jgi:Chaperone of endosialidase
MRQEGKSMFNKKVCYPILRQVALCVAACSLAIPVTQTTAQPLAEDFTVQGALSDNGTTFLGPVDLELRLFGSAVGGSQIGPVVSHNNVLLDNGIFSVVANFGPGAFLGQARWIEIRVADAGLGNFVTLAPRQPVLPSPNALFANKSAAAQDFFNIMGNNATVSFGPTGECSLGIDPNLPGLSEMDPFGFRLLGRNLEGCRLLFGPTDNCRIEIDPDGPSGLTLLDPNCIRIRNPIPDLPIKVLFGETDDCSIGIDPQLPGLRLRDPSCVRVINPIPGLPTKVLFGETDDCSIGIDPQLPGLLLRDIRCVRVLNPDPFGPNKVVFGPTDLCSVGVEPQFEGLLLRDPRCIRILPPDPFLPPVLYWGPTNDCSIGILPDLPGLSETDPTGFRLLGRDLQGCRLIFGPTMDCTVEIDPQGPPGLLLRDITGIRVMNPDPFAGNTLFFGPTDECRIRATEPGFPGAGMMLSDPRGFMFNDGFVGIGLRDKPAQFPLQVAGPIAAEEFIQFSSSAFKEDVVPLDNALEIVNALQGVSFKWKEMNSGRSDVGFIAEEVEKILPQLVRSKDGESMGIAYHRLTAVTVEAIKAQQDQIELLTDERDDLAHRVAVLEEGLAMILEQLESSEASKGGE